MNKTLRIVRCPRALALACAFVTLLVCALAAASPEARILRVNPRAAQENGNPVLTTVVEVSQSKRVSDAVAGCAGLKGGAQLSCMSEALERPLALYTPFPFPKDNAIFTVTVDGTDIPTKFVSDQAWGTSLQQPGVGTAWLILIDQDRRMGGGFADAKQLAGQILTNLGPNDIVNVMFFDDRQVVKDSKWVPAAKRATVQSMVSGTGETIASSGRNRSLLTIIKTAATDGFGALGNQGEEVSIPLHQALVVLSTGFGGADPSTTGPGAMQLAQYLSGGRFPEDNTALPKAPVPVISVWYPPSTFDEFRQNSLEFMQNLANPEIGGFFTVMQSGQGSHSTAIVSSVRERFSKMHIVKWRASCVAPSITQTFKLVFNNVKPPILGDNTFKDVPVGIDPSSWPLDIDLTMTQAAAKQAAIYPGGSFKVYGNFCWSGDKSRAEVYFLPTGQPIPTALGGTDISGAQKAQQQLISMGMKGTSTEASDTSVTFTAPEKDKILWGSGDQALVRFVVYDNKAHRASGVTTSTIISAKGGNQPLPLLLILSGAFGLVVVLLLVAVIVRGGGKKRGGGGGGAPPAPVVAGGYGGAPGGYGGYGAPPPGGYGPPPGQHAPAAHAPIQHPPQAAPAAPAPVQHTPLQQQTPQGTAVSPEFMYGAAGAGQNFSPRTPDPQAPPPNPYGANGATALLHSSAGVYTLLSGQELRAGRDAAQCGIALAEPRVSAVHATFKLDSGQLIVRDEHSNNGTLVNNNRISPGIWAPVPNGSVVRLGPVEFTARLQ